MIAELWPTFWFSFIAASYTGLCLTMWLTAALYAWKTYKNWDLLDLSTAMIMTGISLTFTGHGFDQSFWTLANLEDALGYFGFGLVHWYKENIPALIVFGKFLASFGAFFHWWAALHTKQRVANVVAFYSAGWIVFVLSLTVILM